MQGHRNGPKRSTHPTLPHRSKAQHDIPQSGACADFVSVRTRYGQTRRRRPVIRAAPSPAQVRHRGRFGRIRAMWRTLTDAQRAIPRGVLSLSYHDSHKALPVVPHDRARLEAVEFVPFRAAIAARVAGIMVAHVAFPALEPRAGLASTLSKRVMTDLLRDELNYDGLCLTDSLDMGALETSGYPVDVAATAALSAGADGYLLKEDADSELLSAIDTLRRGGTYISPLLSTQLADLFMQKSRPGTETLTSPRELLTTREREIIKLIAEGLDVSPTPVREAIKRLTAIKPD